MTTDGVPPQRSRVPPPFPAFAYLHEPADATRSATIVEADGAWRLPEVPPSDIDVVLWGRLARNARPSPTLAVQASRRELSIRRLLARPPDGLRVVELHRLEPSQRAGTMRSAIRSATLGGVLVELARGPRPNRVIDDVVRAAGADPWGVQLRPSGDGSALASVDVDGASAELRVAKIGHTKDPARGQAALATLADAGVPLVPRPLGGGRTAGAAWSTESRLTGRHVGSLDGPFLRQIIEFLARLPAPKQDHDGKGAVTEHLDAVSEFFPEYASILAAASTAAERWGSGLSPILIHGDMWLNNVIATDGRLSGVFDWYTWHPAGLPGTDLLNLLAAVERATTGREVGSMFVDDYWRSPSVVQAMRVYFDALGSPAPDSAELAAIAIAWWSSRIHGALYRALRQIDDRAWVERNLVRPLAQFQRLEREFG